ncbi:MAG: pilus assembly protein [Thiobacillus sp.]
MANFKHGILAIGFAWLLPVGIASAATISDIPLFLDNSVVPNVLLNMSVETPMGGAAYADQSGNPTGCGSGSYATPRPSVGGGAVGVCYIPTVEYLGYFNPNKCYTYSSNRFNPSSSTGANHTCSSKWSGNFLNWSTMTAIDMFTWTMTGGNRVIDTTTDTVIRRAKKQNNDSWFPHKLLNATYNVAPSTVTPFSDTSIYIHNTDWGVEIGTTRAGTDKGTFNVQVKVCDSSVGVEANCKAYGGGTYSKPEGLIQKNADKMRFAVTSYLNDGSQSRDGGVLRSKMKHVGPTYATTSGAVANALKEVGTDGILIDNPDGASGYNSGVINYINKFSDAGYKSYDPIGELYYESIRYFKNLGPTPEYYNNWTSYAGGFTVYTTWDDPIQYSCQKNFLVGINDANPWLDKKLPGTFFTCGKAGTTGLPASFTATDCGPPSNPDGDIDVTALTNRVGDLEGLNGAVWSSTGNWTSGPASGQNDSVGYVAGLAANAGSCTTKTVTNLGEVMGTCSYPAKENSYYIAGLAYYANTTDLRSDLVGKQTVSTYLIDSQEYSANPLDGPKNMLWLAGKYGGFKDSNGDGNPNVSSTGTDRKEWDADNDGIPDNYVLASQPEKLVAGLTRAFNDIFTRTSSAAAVASNSTRLTTTTHLYQSLFNSGDWTGQLKAFPLNSDGTIGSMAWDAADHIPAYGSRTIKTWDGSAGADFSGATLATAVGGADQLAYLQGDTSKEQRFGGTFRNRTKILGDIINADPHFVQSENFGYNTLASAEGTSYATFLAGKSSRTAVVYAAANDGMLHAFDASFICQDNNPLVDTDGDTILTNDCDIKVPASSAGTELFAYVPKAVVPALQQLTLPAYAASSPPGHKYLVDGSPTAWDAYWGGTPTWKTVLVGSLGAGGKAVYALDVSNPASFGNSNVLWEFTGTGTQLNNMGYIMGSVTVARFPDGNYWAVFGNGYNSTNGKAMLFMVRVDDPSIVKTIDVGGTANGMSTPVLVDTNGDRIVDLVYAGDLQGNVWKFTFPGSNTGQWKSDYLSGSTPVPLFTAKDSSGTPQPITAPVEVGLAPSGASGLMVYFGTGQYFAVGDNTDISTQSMYGVVDAGSAFTGSNHRNSLQAQTIVYERSRLRDPNQLESETNPMLRDRVISSNNVDYSSEKGWVLDLIPPTLVAEGERVISAPTLFNGSLLYQTITPVNIPCQFGGRSMLMLSNPATGGALALPSFDINKDGSFNSSDMINIGNGVMAQVSGSDTGVGISGGAGKPITAGDRAYVPLSGTSGELGAPPINSGTLKSRASWRQIQ